MKRFIIGTMFALAAYLATAPDAEAGRIRDWLQNRREVRQERRANRSFHPLQRLRGGCCDAGGAEQGGYAEIEAAPEPVHAPREIQPPVRFASQE